jgi:hypothetical protein
MAENVISVCGAKKGLNLVLRGLYKENSLDQCWALM